jgi:predicted transcriptional regulator
MDEQLDLLTRAQGHSPPETSRLALQSIAPHLAKAEQAVLDAIQKSGGRGMTIDELAVALAKDKATVAPRIKPLRLKGAIYSDGSTRRGRSGRLGIVWRAVRSSDALS